MKVVSFNDLTEENKKLLLDDIIDNNQCKKSWYETDVLSPKNFYDDYLYDIYSDEISKLESKYNVEITESADISRTGTIYVYKLEIDPKDPILQNKITRELLSDIPKLRKRYQLYLDKLWNDRDWMYDMLMYTPVVEIYLDETDHIVGYEFFNCKILKSL